MIRCRKTMAAAFLVALLSLGLFAPDGDLQPSGAHAQAPTSPGVTITPIELIVDEGSSATYTVVLDERPTRKVTVTVDGLSNSEVTVHPEELTFEPVFWNIPQIVTVAADQDGDDIDEPQFAITHTVSSFDGDYDGLAIDSVDVSVIDDDKPVHISDIALDIDEGDSAPYTVTLDSQPTADVTVSVGGFAGTDLSLDRTTLTFTDQDWDTAQTVTVTAGQDDDGVDETTRLIHTVTSLDSKYNGLTTVGVYVTVTDPDTQGLTMTLADRNVDEGKQFTYTVVLDTQPTSDVTIEISNKSEERIEVYPDQLLFTTQNWETAQMVTVSVGHDPDTVDYNADISHVAAGGDYFNLNVVRVLTVIDDDPEMAYSFVNEEREVEEDAGIVRIGVSAETTEAGVPTRSYFIEVATTEIEGEAQNWQDYVGIHEDFEFTPEGFVAFEDGNGQGRYRQIQYIDFIIVDGKVPEDAEKVELRIDADPVEGTEPDSTIYVTIIDDDFVGMTVNPASISVAEGAHSTYTMKLDTQPSGDVTVTINDPSDGEVTAEPGSLTFSFIDWYIPQTVTVTADHDVDDVDELPLAITHTLSSTDSEYNGFGADSVIVAVKDDDDSGVTVSETSLDIGEGGSAVYTVVLDSQPTGEVTIAISGIAGTGLSVDDGTVLMFNAQDWSTAQTVTVTAQQDDDAVDVTATLVHDVTSADDSDYDGLTADRVVVAVSDDDAVGVSVSETSLEVEVGESDDYTVVLHTRPTGDVTVDIGGLNGTYLSGDRTDLVFTRQNWDTPQTVTVTLEQDPAAGGVDKVAITHTVSSAADGQYDGLIAAGVTVTVLDPDTARMIATPRQLTVDEGSVSSYEVVLDSQPTTDVTVKIINDYLTSGFRVNPASLTFTPQDWSTPRTVEVSGRSDGNSKDEGSSLFHRVTGGDYPGGVRADMVDVLVRDDDPSIDYSLVKVEPVEEDAGKARIWFVAVTNEAGRLNVLRTVALSSVAHTAESGVDYSPLSSQFFLFQSDFDRFVNDNGETRYRGAVSSEISIVDDKVPEETEYFQVVLEGGPGNDGFREERIVTIIDDDFVGVNVMPTDIAVTEGASSTYKVALDTQPTGDVTVTINDPSNTEVTADQASLTFTPTTFLDPQTVTVSASHDPDRIDEEPVVITHTVSSTDSDYDGLKADSVTVNVSDDDVPPVKVSFGSASYTVAEGASVTVTVTLDADPERTVTVPITKANEEGASGDDYSGVPASVIFNNGETSKTFTFAATHDTVDDDGEKVKLTFGTLPARVTEDTISETVVSITDDDVPPVKVSFGSASYSVEESDNPATTSEKENEVAITVTLDADPERTVTIPITKANEEGASGDDYSGVPASVIFNNGETSKTFTFAATHDTVDDDGEKVKLTFGTLPARVTEDTISETVVSITDDDVPPVKVSFGSASYSVEESDNPATTSEKENEVAITVTLDADPERTVTIPITRTNEDGASDDDYSGVPASVTFAATETSKTFTFAATHDTVDDDGEKVKLTFGTLPARVTEDTISETVVSITDDDVPPVKVSFGSASYTVAEGASVTVTVTLDADPERTVTIPITKANEEGASGDDYSGVPASVIFNNGETSKTFTFTATHDTVDDDGESVKLGFGNTLPSRVTAGSPSETVVSITDDDVPPVMVSFDSTTYSATEGGADAVVTVRLSTPATRQVDIPVTAKGSNGATPDDWTGAPTVLTFNTDDTERSFTLVAFNDTAEDNGETVELGFGDLPGEFVKGSPATARVTLINDDNTPGDPTLEPDGEDDFSSRCGDTRASLTIGEPFRGRLGITYDVDATMVGFTASALGYRVSLRDDANEHISAEDFYFGIVHPDKNWGIYASYPYLTNWVDDRDSLIFIPEETATYCVQITARGGRYIGDYNILVEEGMELLSTAVTGPESDAHRGDVVQGIPPVADRFHRIFVGTDRAIAGEIWDPTDSDWYITQLADGIYRATVEGYGTGKGTLRGPGLLVRRADAREYMRGETLTSSVRLEDVERYGGRWVTEFEITETDRRSDLFHLDVWSRDDTVGTYTLTLESIEAFTDPEAEPESSEQVVSNTPATGQPGIAGTPRVDGVMTATTTGITDEDGLDNVAFSYQWIRRDLTTDTGADIGAATHESYTLTAEDEGKGLRVRVTFNDDAGFEESLTSHTVLAAAPLVLPPDAPGDLNIDTQGVEILKVSWAAPSGDGGSAITGYQVQWKESADSWDTPEDVSEETTTGTTHSIRGLTGGVKYTVRVRAVNGAGAGAPSDEATGIPMEPASEEQEDSQLRADPPSAPQNLTAAVNGDGSITLSWDALDDDSITGYRILRRRPSEGEKALLVYVEDSGSTATTYTDSEVTAGTEHVYRVRAINEAGVGGQSKSVSITPQTDEEEPNSPATGAPTITGTVRVGEKLTVDTSGIEDLDGLNGATFSYVWVANDETSDTDITGATDSTYTLADADEGKTIKVRVSFTDAAGNDESLTSAATTAVEAKPNSPATGVPAISGTAQVGETLTADTSGIADADGLTNVSYGYQWLADDVEVQGATEPAYTLADADEGKPVKLRVSFTDDAGNEEALTSAATAAVEAEPESQEPPAKPTGLTGTVAHDEVALIWNDPGDESITGYQILRLDRDVHGLGNFQVHVDDTGSAATAYVDRDVTPETRYVYRIKARSAAGLSVRSEYFNANTPPTPNHPATGLPTISGTAQVGETLTADISGVEDADGMDNAVFSYQWVATDGGSELDIEGATGASYTLIDIDAALRFMVRVSFTDDGGNEETLTSEVTAVVARAK